VSNYYRKEIDGIRALAILPVVLFHTGISYFEGGYVGVDIFFVISGYLITRLIKREYQEKNFQFISFYERRIRRIIPALFFMVIITSILSYFIMTPSDLVSFYKSSIANSLFLSNLFFWVNINYFSNPAELIPLIHMWSISIEEQFYLLFPIFFIFLLKKMSFEKILIILFFFSFLSILFSQIVGNFNLNQPYIEEKFSFFYISSASFYLPMARAWELLVGSMIAIYLNKKKYLINKHSNIYILLGILLIIFPVFTYDKNIPYSSFYTLLPVLGTVLLILFLNPSNILYNFFTNRLIIFFGLISYSLYLWHQPIFSLYRLYFLDEPSLFNYLILIFISVLISFISWKYIEAPFRSKLFLSRSKIFLLFFIITFSIVLINIIGVKTNGFNKIKVIENKLTYKKNILIDRKKKVNEMINLQKIFLNKDKEIFLKKNNKQKFLIIGDSHARDLYISVRLNEKHLNNLDFYKLTLGNNCLFYLLNKEHTRNKNCEKELKEIIDNNLILDNSDYIIFSMRYYKDPVEKFELLLNQLPIDMNKIIIMGARSEFYKQVNLALNLVLKEKSKSFIEKKLYFIRKKHTDKLNIDLENYSKKNKFRFINLLRVSCNLDKLKCDFFDKNYNLYYYDYGHWTREGANFFGKKISETLNLLTSN